MMNYQDTLSYILKQLPMYQRIGNLAYRSGLDNTLRLDDYFNHPHRHFKTIHVAGTNGKGSVSHMLASVLQEAGYKTGLYTSPHLVDFRERIRVNGKIITEKYVTDFINGHKDFFETFDPSFFEISVFMGFEYFKQNQVDIAVIEVGLGGRLDATNIISPMLSVITNIGMDHTEILGDTIKKIAAEKAGIIKTNIPVVIGENQEETLPVFSDFCSEKDAPLISADKIYSVDYSLMSTDECQIFNVRRQGEMHFPNLKCGLLGHYQRKNIITVLAAIDQLTALKINKDALYNGIKNVVVNTGLSGRWQIMNHNPKIICDTAHNAEGISMVLQQVTETPYRKLHMLIGFVNDKNTDAIMKYMPEQAVYYYVRLSVPRTMDENELASKAQSYGLIGTAYKNMEDAYKTVKAAADKDDLVVITGSNFLVADFLNMASLRGLFP